MRRRQRILKSVMTFFVVIAFDCLNFAFAAPVSPVQRIQPRVAPVRRTVSKKNMKTPSTVAVDNATRAKTFFAAGDYQKALIFGNADLRANPTRKQTMMLMAQSYYRLGRPGPAAKLFLRLSPDDLTSDAAVEYTLTMFATKRYSKAIKAWVKINPEHPYRDVARFYAGVSYMHLKLFNKASQLLRHATKIPGDLKTERRRLISELDEILDRQRRGNFSGDQAYGYQTQQRYYQLPVAPPVEPIPAAPGGPATPPPAVAAKKTPEPPAKSGYTYSATPEVSYSTKSSKKDFNGYTQSQGSSRTPAVSVPLSLKYSGKPRSFGGQPSITFNVTPSYEDTEATSTDSKLVALDSAPDEVASQTSQSSSHSFSASLNNVVDILYPVSDAVDLGVGYQDKHTLPDAASKNEATKSGPSAKFIIEGDLLKGQLDWSTYDFASKLASPAKIKTVMTTSGSLSRTGETSVTTLKATFVQTDQTSKTGENSSMGGELNWDKTWEDVNLGLSGGYQTRTAYPDSVIADSQAGVDMNAGRTQMTAGFTLKWTLSFGLALNGSFSHAEFSDYETRTVSADDPTASTVISSAGSKNSFGLGGTLSIGSYVSVEASYNYTDRKINVGDAANEALILKNACSQLTESSLKLSLRYPF